MIEWGSGVFIVLDRKWISVDSILLLYLAPGEDQIHYSGVIGLQN